ncbi:MAG: hypothetical protein IJX63_06670 [Lachnospiraceae bacterium]|nr:hypothetical protein [Lachnospiraceae bacterium]
MAENKFELQVSEPIPNEADYQLSKEELTAWFDEQYELLQAGKKQGVTMEFAMLGHAMDFVDFAKQATQIELDFEEESLGAFEAILEAIYELFGRRRPSNEEFVDMVKRATGYFGVMILKNIGGNWVQSNIGMGIQIKGTNAFVYNKIARRLSNGREDEVISFYEALKGI